MVTDTATAHMPCAADMAHLPSLAGTLTLISLALSTVNEVAATSPKWTLVAPASAAPMMCTVLPPATGPLGELT